jgi:hypothetical protein
MNDREFARYQAEENERAYQAWARKQPGYVKDQIIAAAIVAVLFTAALFITGCAHRPTTSGRAYMEEMSAHYAHCDAIGWTGPECEELQEN